MSWRSGVQEGVVARLFSLLRSPSVIYLGASVLGRLGAVLLIPLYTKQLTQEEFGLLSLAGTLQTVLSLLLPLGLTGALSKVYFDTPNGQPPESRVAAVARLILLAVGLTAGLLGATAVLLWPAHGLGGFSLHRVLLVLAGSAATSASAIPDAWYRARRLAWSSAGLNLVAFTLSVSLSLQLVLCQGRGLDGALEAACASQVAVGVWGLVFSLRLGRPSRDGPSLRQLLRFSLPFVPHFLASWAFSVGDRWALKALGQDSLLGLYALGQQLATPIPLVASAFNDSEVAALGQRYREMGGRASLRRELVSGVSRYLGVVALPYCALLVSWPLLDSVLGARFEVGLGLLPFVGLAGIVESAYYPAVNVLFYASRTGWIPLVTVTSALLSIALVSGLTAAWGMPGLVVARIASALLRSAICLGLAWRSLRTLPPESAGAAVQ